MSEHVCGQIEDELCEECCEHDDVCTDERVCLDCGADRTEHMMSMAYDRVKDFRKYGS